MCPHSGIWEDTSIALCLNSNTEILARLHPARPDPILKHIPLQNEYRPRSSFPSLFSFFDRANPNLENFDLHGDGVKETLLLMS